MTITELLLLSFSKIYDSALNGQLAIFRILNNIIPSEQHGIVKKKFVKLFTQNFPYY